MDIESSASNNHMLRKLRFWRASHQRSLLRNIILSTLIILVLLWLYASPSDNYKPSPLSGQYDPQHTFHEIAVDVSPEVWKQRAQAVKEAFVHAYHGYERHAAPKDELKPVSNNSVNNFNGWGVSAFDSLDTLLLMDLQPEFSRALEIVKKADFTVSEQTHVPFFETIIRYLGGLLSGYALSKELLLLDRAEELASILDPIFESPSGLPFFGINPFNGEALGPKVGILAEVASLQVEYTYLAKATGNAKFMARANNVMRTLYSADLSDTGGMLPVRWNLSSGQVFTTHTSIGAQADSTHEYLLKQYLLTSKTDKASLEMYLKATTHTLTDLLFLSPTRHLLYVTDTFGPSTKGRSSPSHIFEHLSCFFPGLLALGVHTLPLDDLASLGISLPRLGNTRLYGAAGVGYKTLARYNLTQLHLWAAEGLAETCWLTYADQPSGLGPDEVVFLQGRQGLGTESSHRVETPSVPWMDAMEKWRGSGARGVPPGVGPKKPLIYSLEERMQGLGSGRDYFPKKSEYLLRPETIESFYLLWKVTGNPKWRARGWRIFEALERETKTLAGYTSLHSVESSPAPQADDMPSYFLAETLKYLYLMFLDTDPIPLDKWVFNTEAHPLPIFEWTPHEKDIFNV